MTQRIYIVTSGEYSDYRIEAAYTTYEEALEAAKKVAKPDANKYIPSFPNIEVFEGNNRMWDAEEEIEKQAHTLYEIRCEIRPQGARTFVQEERVFISERAKVRKFNDRFIVTGTDLTEVKKVLSDTLTAEYQAQVQNLVEKIGE